MEGRDMTATATSASATGAPGGAAHRDRNVLRWLTAYTASLLGDSVYFLALGFAAARSVPPAQVGLVMAVGAVPRAALMLGGGVVADRFGPRRVVIGSDALRCVLILCAAAVLALGSPGLWLLVTVALVFGVVDALFMPAVGALPPRLVAPDQLIRLQGMRALAIRSSTVAGPPLGGLAMGLGGASAAFAVAGGLFAISVPLLVTTRVGRFPKAEQPAGARASAWGELRDGLRYIRRHRLLGPLVLSGAVCELGLVGPLNVGMVLLSQDRGWGSSGYGWIIAAFGAGSGASALLLTVRGRLPRAGAVQIVTLFASSATIGVIGLAPVLLVAVGAALLTGLISGICGGLASALIQSAAEPGYLGRITSVMSLTGFGLAPMAYPLFGEAVALWGPAPVFLTSAGFAALGGLVGLLTPAVRSARLP
jgi:MFS family permease